MSVLIDTSVWSQAFRRTTVDGESDLIRELRELIADGNALVIGGSVAIPAFVGASWLGPLLLAILIAAEIAFYRVMLRPAGQLLESRRESLIEALQV